MADKNNNLGNSTPDGGNLGAPAPQSTPPPTQPSPSPQEPAQQPQMPSIKEAEAAKKSTSKKKSSTKESKISPEVKEYNNTQLTKLDKIISLLESLDASITSSSKNDKSEKTEEKSNPSDIWASLGDAGNRTNFKDAFYSSLVETFKDQSIAEILTNSIKGALPESTYTIDNSEKADGQATKELPDGSSKEVYDQAATLINAGLGENANKVSESLNELSTSQSAANSDSLSKMEEILSSSNDAILKNLNTKTSDDTLNNINKNLIGLAEANTGKADENIKQIINEIPLNVQSGSDENADKITHVIIDGFSENMQFGDTEFKTVANDTYALVQELGGMSEIEAEDETLNEIAEAIDGIASSEPKEEALKEDGAGLEKSLNSSIPKESPQTDSITGKHNSIAGENVESGEKPQGAGKSADIKADVSIIKPDEKQKEPVKNSSLADLKPLPQKMPEKMPEKPKNLAGAATMAAAGNKMVKMAEKKPLVATKPPAKTPLKKAESGGNSLISFVKQIVDFLKNLVSLRKTEMANAALRARLEMQNAKLKGGSKAKAAGGGFNPAALVKALGNAMKSLPDALMKAMIAAKVKMIMMIVALLVGLGLLIWTFFKNPGLAKKIGGWIGNAFKWLGKTIYGWIKKASPIAIIIVGALIALMTLIYFGPVAALWALGAVVLALCIKYWNQIYPLLLGVFAAYIGFLIFGPWGLLIGAVVLLGALIWKFRAKIWEWIKKIGKFFIKVITWPFQLIMALFPSLGDKIKDAWNKFKGFLSKIPFIGKFFRDDDGDKSDAEKKAEDESKDSEKEKEKESKPPIPPPKPEKKEITNTSKNSYSSSNVKTTNEGASSKTVVTKSTNETKSQPANVSVSSGVGSDMKAVGVTKSSSSLNSSKSQSNDSPKTESPMIKILSGIRKIVLGILLKMGVSALNPMKVVMGIGAMATLPMLGPAALLAGGAFTAFKLFKKRKNKNAQTITETSNSNNLVEKTTNVAATTNEIKNNSNVIDTKSANNQNVDLSKSTNTEVNGVGAELDVNEKKSNITNINQPESITSEKSANTESVASSLVSRTSEISQISSANSNTSVQNGSYGELIKALPNLITTGVAEYFDNNIINVKSDGQISENNSQKNENVQQPEPTDRNGEL